METISAAKKKPHAVCVALPFQSHINALLKLAKVLHFKGFHITFVTTQFIYQRVLANRGPDSLKGLPDFRFETIPDGLPSLSSGIDVCQEVVDSVNSITKTGPAEIRNLITRLNQASADPAVSCLVSDSNMVCTVDVAQELGIPQFLFWPASVVTFVSYLYSAEAFKIFSTQLKDKGGFTEMFLHTPADFIPGLKGFQLRDFTRYILDFSTDSQIFEENLNLFKESVSKVSGVIINSFDAIESGVLDLESYSLPAVYTIGPLHFLEQEITDKRLASFGFNLLKEHHDCFEWLDSKKPNSVVYVNFGSITVMTQSQLTEFAWGLANSKHTFLWVIRPNLVKGEAAVLPKEFVEQTADRGMISGWCPQEEVLRHSSIGGFLTHSGWNSILDAICAGVPVINWPFFGDQQPNSKLACAHWGIGMEIDNNVKREDVEGIVREVMEGEKGKEMKRKSIELKKKAEESMKPGGSSYENLHKLVMGVSLQEKKPN